MNIIIVGKRWFDKVNGNTYHTAMVYVDDKVYNIPFTYGYGDHYVQSAKELLQKEGIIKIKVHENGYEEPFWRHCQENDINIKYQAIDVSRKKDLK